MKAKNLVVAFVAVVSGLGAAVLAVSSFIPRPVIEETVMVVVAIVPLKQGDALTDVEKQLTLKPFPRPLVSEYHVTNLEDLKGKTISRHIEVGEAVTRKDVNSIVGIFP